MFKIELSADNAAFSDGIADEIARILYQLADDLPILHRQIGNEGVIRDANGNRVGEWTWQTV